MDYFHEQPGDWVAKSERVIENSRETIRKTREMISRSHTQRKPVIHTPENESASSRRGAPTRPDIDE
jgi:hypothetical protein